MTEVSFGEWLKRRRKAGGLTQEQLAEQVSCSTIALRKIEAEERRPSAQIVERLAEIFNIPPNEQTQFLRFARGDWRAAPTIESEDAPWHTPTTATRSNLPASITALVGREQDIATVREYLSSANIRLVTLIGPPGIGKTRLSVEVAQKASPNFPDGTFFVALAPLEDPSLVALTIAQALSFVETQNSSLLDQLKDGIGDKQMLIVLDNVEHLIEMTATLVSDLLLYCPYLKILATSREALRVPGEWLYHVPTLNIPAVGQLQSLAIEEIPHYTALTLFAERARAVRSDFVLNADNIQAVANICIQLDGLPLAIELIAARVRLMSPQALLTKLNAQFVLSADGMRAVPARQKTLHGAIAWSYDLLSPEEQKLFARLSVFSGGFSLGAAESIFSRTIPNKSASDLMASLLDKSLLQRTLDARAEPRFNMLVTIQQFALDRLRHINEETEVRNRHLDYFLDLAEQADKQIHGPEQAVWMDRLELEFNNFCTALDWCISNQKTEIALRLLGALGWAWLVRTRHTEVYSWFDKIHTLYDFNEYPALYAKLLNQMGFLGWLLGDYQTARSTLEESQAIWLKLGAAGEPGLAEMLNDLGMVVRWCDGDNGKAASLFEKSLAMYQKQEDEQGIARVLSNLGRMANDQNNDVSALSLLEQSMDLFKQLGDLWSIGRSCFFLGQLFLKQGNHEKGRLFFGQYLTSSKTLRFKQGTVLALLSLGDSYRHQGDYTQAEQFYEKGLAISHRYSLKEGQAGARNGLGLVELGRSDYLLATQYFKNAYNTGRTFHQIWSAIDFLFGFAAIAAGMNQLDHAAKIYGAAQALDSSYDLPDLSYDRVECDNLVQIARKQLGEAKFEALAAEGRAMTMEQAIEYALEIEE